MSEQKRILAISEGAEHVCARYRVVPFGWALAECGWELTIQPIERSLPKRLAQIASACQFDAVLLQRKLLPVWQVMLLRRAAKRLVYDFDDAIFQRDSYAAKPPESVGRTARFWATVYAADAVLAGNDYLRARATDYVEPEKVTTIPTCVEPDRYRPTPEKKQQLAGRLATGSPVRAVWIGSKSTVPSLVDASECLAAAASRVTDFRLRLICDHFPTIPGVQTEPCVWSESTEADDLASADFGVSVLPDDGWSRGKCGLKVLQYMAAGLPVIANPIGVHCEMIRDGENGFLADSPEAWATAAERLATDPALRHRLGQAARQTVERHYSIAAWSQTFASQVTGELPATPKSQLPVPERSLLLNQKTAAPNYLSPTKDSRSL